MNDSLRKVLGSFSWLFIEKGIKLSIGLVVTIMITRHLGVEKYGEFNYILAIAAIFSPLATLGMEVVTIRELINKPAKTMPILGSSLVLRLLGGGLVLLFSMFVSWFWVKNGKELSGLICLAASGYLFQAFDVIDYYNQSQQIMKRSVISRLAAFLLVNGLKVFAIAYGANLQVFILLFQVEFFFACVFYLTNYGKKIKQWTFNKKVALNLLKDSWPAIIISLSASIQAYFDQIILGSRIGHGELSQYTVALTLVNALTFAPMIIYMATSPEIFKAKKISNALYYEKLKRVYRFMFLLSLFTILPLLFFSDDIIFLIYGNDYNEAGNYLALFSLRLFFVNIGMAKQLYIVSENLFKFQLYSSLVGMLVNVCLNLVLIPKYSSMGAYVAILVSYSLTVFLNDLFSSKMRFNLKLIVGSIGLIKTKA